MWEFHSIFIYWNTQPTQERPPKLLSPLSQKLILSLSLCPINTNSPTKGVSTTISCPPSQTKQNTKQRAATTSPTPTTPTPTTTSTTQQSPQHQSNQTPKKKKKKKKKKRKEWESQIFTTPPLNQSQNHPHPTLTPTRSHAPTHPPTLDGG